MASGASRGSVLHELGRAFNEGSVAGMGEGQLLKRFADDGDALAFGAIVARHGPMVLGVCRRVLPDPNDADDAFQATFLVLARKARSLRDADLVGPWLFGVASRVSARARTDAARRLARETSASRSESESFKPAPSNDQDELRRALDDEINRLPEKYRRPIVLCCVQGQSHEEAARRLRCTTGSLRGRLDRARAALRSRLTQRGFAPAAVLAVLASATESSAASVPAPLAAGAVAVAQGAVAPAMKLADAVIRSWHVARLKVAASVAVLAAIPLGLVLSQNARDENPAQPAPAVSPAQVVTVTGRVLNFYGLPIDGARVARGSKPLEVLGSETLTNAEGRFAFPDVERAELIVTVQAPGCAPELQRIAASKLEQPITFRLGPGHTVRGRIVDLNGKPIAGAPVSAGPWRGAQSLRWSSQTDSEGSYRWDEAPTDEVLIDIGSLGYRSKRFVTLKPGGAEQSIAMPRPLFVRGSVTDAETGRPIAAFTVLTGMARQWEYDRARHFRDGSYEIKLDGEYSSEFVRIEAEEYRSETSPEYTRKGTDHVFDVKLQREAGIAGIVRQPDGAPLAGAEVLISRPNHWAWVTSGEPHDRRRLQIVKTGSDGRFTLPLQAPPYTIVALHPTGIAYETFTRPATAHELTIQPWGRIEGILRIGARPGVGETLLAQPRLNAQRKGFDDPTTTTLLLDAEARADADGRFRIERVAPGKSIVQRVIQVAPLSRVYTHQVQVTVPPGTTESVTIGGTGRPVVGRVKVPANIAGQVDWRFSHNYIRAQPPNLKLEGLDPEARKQWFAAWSRSPEGQAYHRMQERTYAVIVRPDGTFRVEDVDAGAYQLVISLDRPPADPTRCAVGGERLAMALHNFEVPAIEGGRSDEPFDLGPIALQPQEVSTVVNVSELAPQFQAETLEGKTRKLTDFRGKYVLLDFWATWCKPCLEEIPHLKAVHEAFGKDERFAMIGLSLDEMSSTARDFAAKQRLSWEQAFLGDWSKTKVPAEFGVWGIPSIWLIGPDGKLIAKDLRGGKIQQAVAEALGGKR